MASTASMSNPPLFLTPFGLPPWLTPIQRPIYLSFSFLLDFNLSPNRFNVQSASLSRSFWTSTCLHSASMSNPPQLFFSTTYIYESPLSKSLTLHPYFPQFSHLLPTTKNSRRNKPCGSNHTLY
jgi:hypothetical protein